jgi:hypothetical protein
MLLLTREQNSHVHASVLSAALVIVACLCKCAPHAHLTGSLVIGVALSHDSTTAPSRSTAQLVLVGACDCTMLLSTFFATAAAAAAAAALAALSAAAARVASSRSRCASASQTATAPLDCVRLSSLTASAACACASAAVR